MQDPGPLKLCFPSHREKTSVESRIKVGGYRGLHMHLGNATCAHLITSQYEAPRADCEARSAFDMTPATPTPGPPSYDARNAGSRSRPSEATKPKPRQTSPVVAAPASHSFFDPWNSSSTGHQRAENRLSGSTSWRVSRNLKLGEQFKSGTTGGKRVADTVGAGSEAFGKDGRKENGGREKGAKGLRTGGQKSLAEVWGASKTGKKLSQEKDTNRDVSSNGERTSDQGTICVYILVYHDP